MTLKSTQLGGRIPLPLRGTFPSGEPSRMKSYEPGATGDKPAPGVGLSCILSQSWAAPITKSSTGYISTGIAGGNTTTVTSVAGSAAWDGAEGATGVPDFPRGVIVTVTHGSSIVAVSGVITGVDQYGRTVTETWSVTATGTSKTYSTKTSFAKVLQITVVSVADATADTVQLGTTDLFGLNFPAAMPSPLKEITDGATPTAGTVVAASSAGNADYRGTFTPNTATNGSHSYTLWYISDDPTLY